MSTGRAGGVVGAVAGEGDPEPSPTLPGPRPDSGARSELVHVPVAVVIPCYRCRPTIERAVRSVIEQTAPPEELWLVDDASPDGGDTLSELHALGERYGSRVDIHVVRLPANVGPAGARNAGWDAARQPYVAFLDADDSWHPRKLEIQYRWMRDHPDVAATGHGYVEKPAHADPAALPDTWDSRPVGRGQILRSNRFSTPTVMLRRDLVHRFEPRLRCAEDFHLWAELVLDGEAVHELRLPLAYGYKHVFGTGGLSGALWDMQRGELAHYRLLRGKGHLSWWSAAALCGYSLVKYARRWVICRIRGR